MTVLFIACVIAFGCIVVYIQRCNSVLTRPLPPGPPGLLWFGNVFQINLNKPWLAFHELAKTYGGIIYLKLFGWDFIVISSEKIAEDLLEKRSSNTSDRPRFPLKLYGVDGISAFLQYGGEWRLHRQLFHQTFRSSAVSRFHPLYHQKACHFLRQLFDTNTSEQLHEHLLEYTASVIFNSTYDHEFRFQNNDFLEIAANAQEAFQSTSHSKNALLVIIFPILLKLKWFPSMSVLGMTETSEKLKIIKRCVQVMQAKFEYAVQKGVGPSMIYDALQGMKEKGIAPDKTWMEALKGAAMTSCLVASDTSHTILMKFFLMMVLNPEVQKKAQAQIDAVVGRARLPTMDDRSLLPFLDAILWETLRCHPLAPLSVPHVTTEDDMYAGYHIPKGTVVFANVWSMARDESRYPNSQSFMPERFLNDDGSLKPNDIEHIAYGFGRRICVGRYFADASLWAMIAKVLAVFKILKPLDENGMEVPVEPKFSEGLETHPLPFGCRIVPRYPGMDAEKLEELIAASTV